MKLPTEERQLLNLNIAPEICFVLQLENRTRVIVVHIPCVRAEFANNYPRVANWPFMSSHWQVTTIVLAYLGLVRYGPKWMQRRNPQRLNNMMIGYNLGIAGLNFYISKEMAKAVWWFFVSKIIELTDTAFLIARKKNDQLSFLHVYHHATMVVFWWIGSKWVAGGSAFFPAMTNSAVHVLMYSYYGLAALGPTIRRLLWWKPYLTQIQMMQFVAGLYFGIQSFYITCEFPLWMKCAFITYMASLLILFANFYNRRYKKEKKGH